MKQTEKIIMTAAAAALTAAGSVFAVYKSRKNTAEKKEVNITPEQFKMLQNAQQGELDAVNMYVALSKAVKDEKDKAVFLQLASEEGRHANVFYELSGKRRKPGNTKAILIPMLYRTIGKEKLYPMIAEKEYDAARNYEALLEDFPSIESVRADEVRHGDLVKGLLDEPVQENQENV